ncbi:ABC transporter substrate-binding protein [Piscinibacter sp. HJYY11]|uniref:ABC transporter substrate-binding protein n=1 Tax=Piscinibacter sp. HJYY11 TaxID=2801333 RepID=UPI00191E8DD3|nr:ABC transporter substrate-binding protein [Piscinibacter sp. HJYY11]MBL0730011.1 ABC transporter substrate-binding protein [Piscinibacter sp. HJYY11]
MSSTLSLARRLAVALGTLVFAAAAQAQIVIGQTAAFTGPVAAGVEETTAGARLYLDAINAAGGVHGKTVQLVSLDDKFDPKLAGENARKLIVEHRAVALFLSRGTPHTQAMLPALNEFKVPLVGPSTGAMALHKPVHPYVFNVRATYQREAERAVKHLSLIGMDRIAVWHVDDAFGADAAAGAAKGFDDVKKQPLAVEKFDRNKPDFSTIAPRLAAAEGQAVLIIGTAAALVEGTKAIRAAGSRAQVVTLSNNASGGFIKQMGPLAAGVIVTQVFPYERSLAAPIVKEAVDHAQAKGLQGVSPAMMEGYAAAKVLVLGLRRAGPNLTPAKLVEALNGLGKVELGGMDLHYARDDHTGLVFTDLSIIGQDGKFRR